MNPLPGRRSSLVFLLSVMACLQAALAQNQTENTAAFNGSAALTNLSYHRDSMSGGVPQVATTPRTPLSYASSVTTISWDPVGRPDIYQQKVIGSNTYNCTLVGTFTNSFGRWDQPGTTMELTISGNTTRYIFPYVTSGNDLKSYLTTTYFTTSSVPDPAAVTLRIQQAPGLPADGSNTKGLAFFWAPLQNIARSGYSADASVQMPTLTTFSDGSYQPVNNAPSGFQYVDFADNAKLYTGPNAVSDFVEYNQAQTYYPWTAMGYTYNWNSLQDGSNPAYGSDPFHAPNPFGLTEFVVSGGSTVLLDSWVPNSDLGLWAVPEPGAVFLFLAGGALLLVGYRLRRLACREGGATPSP